MWGLHMNCIIGMVLKVDDYWARNTNCCSSCRLHALCLSLYNVYLFCLLGYSFEKFDFGFNCYMYHYLIKSVYIYLHMTNFKTKNLKMVWWSVYAAEFQVNQWLPHPAVQHLDDPEGSMHAQPMLHRSTHHHIHESPAQDGTWTSSTHLHWDKS